MNYLNDLKKIKNNTLNSLMNLECKLNMLYMTTMELKQIY